MALSVSDLLNLINTNLPDNTTQEIDPSDVRDTLTQIVQSVYTKIDDREIIGMSEYDTTKAYILNECVAYSNDIYQCIVSVSTIGAFNAIQWKQISTYIASTSGLSIYAEKQNVIELDNNKLIKSITTDTSLSGLQSGIYMIQASTIPVGITEEYPITGKSIIFSLKRTASAESLYICYPTQDLTKYFIKRGNSNWYEFKSAGSTTTFSNGLTKYGDDVQATGTYSVIELSGDDYTINASGLIRLNGATAITGDVYHTGNYRLGNDIANITGNTTDTIITGGLIIPNMTTQSISSNIKLMVVDTANNRITYVPVEAVQNSTSGTGGIVILPVGDNGITLEDEAYKLGGSLVEDTTIDGSYDLTISNKNTTIESTGTIDIEAVHVNINGTTDLNIDANTLDIDVNSTISIDANAPITITSNANIDLTSNAPINLRATASPIFLKSDNAPIYFNTPFALRYQNTDSDSSLYGGGNDLFIPHTKWVKDYVADNSSTGGSVILYGTNGITVDGSTMGLGGNFVHTSDNDLIYDYTYYNTATSLDPYNYYIYNYNYGSDGTVLNNSTYQFGGYGAYFYANENKTKLRFESNQLEFTSSVSGDSTYRFQNNNLYISTANSDYSNRMSWALTPNGIYSYTQNGASDNTTFTTGSSQFYYSATQSSNYFYLQATASQLYYNSTTPTTSVNFSGGTSLNYYYYNSSSSDTVSFNAGVSSLYYSNTDSESTFSLGGDNFQVKTGGELVIDNRTLQSSAGIVLNWGAGNIKSNFTTVSVDYDLLVTDYLIIVEGTDNIIINLPVSVDNTGRELIFKHKNRASYTTTITAQSGELIDDSNTLIMASAYTNIKLMCDGTQWLIVSI